LNGLFGSPAQNAPVDWQKLACALATRGAFSIVTGGPGTGKTTTVVRLLALLQAPRWSWHGLAHPPGGADRQSRRTA
jgi:exodeoxyribonuclease V alpha subunit